VNRRPIIAVPALALGALALAGPASAHVTVNPNTATGGSYAKLTFRVPTESDTASTTKLAVYFPSTPAFASVSVKPHPGWSYRVSDTDQHVAKIVWTADAPADRIKPGQFDEFDISLGPLPGSGSVTFKALQTYSDGSVVRWIEPTVAGQPEPQHPAPMLTLTKAATDPAAVAEKDGDSAAPLVLSIVALVVAVAGAGVSVLRRRQP
jgi:periplasmic copper chaperone A